MKNNTLKSKFFIDYDISKYTQRPFFGLLGKIFNIELEGILEVALYNKDLTTLTLQVKKTPNEFHRYDVQLEKNGDALYVRWDESTNLKQIGKRLMETVKGIKGTEKSL